MSSPRNARGFTLIEAIMVVVLLTIATSITMSLLNSEQKRQVREGLVQQQAEEMVKLSAAVKSYLATAEALPETEGEIFAITMQSLFDAGLLPAGFASRPASGSTVPMSPMGQAYSATATLAADGYRALILPTGTPNTGFLARAGVPATDAAFREYAAAVMQRLRHHHGQVSSVITQDTEVVDAAVTGYSYDLDDFLGAAPAIPTVAALVNFTDLETAAPEIGGDDSVSACHVKINDACPSGTREDWTYTTCQEWGPGSDLPLIENVGNGSIRIIRTKSIAEGSQSSTPFSRPEGGQQAIFYTKAVGVGSWTLPSGVALTSASKWGTTPCSGTTSVEYKPFLLDCAATGETTVGYRNTACGVWHYSAPAPGDSCSTGGYHFSANAMYQAGLTDNTRGLAVVGIDGPVISGSQSQNGYPYILHLPDNDEIIRTLSPCAGSTNALPTPIYRKDLGGGEYFEYMIPRAGIWREQVYFGDTSLSGGSMQVTGECGYERQAASNASVPGGGSAAVGVNGCPVKSYHRNDTGGTINIQGRETFLLPYPASDKTKVVRLCCG